MLVTHHPHLKKTTPPKRFNGCSKPANRDEAQHTWKHTSCHLTFPTRCSLFVFAQKKKQIRKPKSLFIILGPFTSTETTSPTLPPRGPTPLPPCILYQCWKEACKYVSEWRWFRAACRSWTPSSVLQVKSAWVKRTAGEAPSSTQLLPSLYYENLLLPWIISPLLRHPKKTLLTEEPL